MALVKGRPVYLALSGETMEFDGNAKCVAGGGSPRRHSAPAGSGARRATASLAGHLPRHGVLLNRDLVVQPAPEQRELGRPAIRGG